ncbi:MAG: DUF1254 domain-containing protein [Promethearchaeota archaeon]
MSDKKLSLAAEAYLYGYPLVYNLDMMSAQAAGKVVPAGPVNIFGHARALLGPEVPFVAPNNDTLYSNLMADVTKEPLVLHLPDTHGRYYVMQFVDAWTNNFAYLGRRATGTAEGLYLLAGPDWAGEIPTGMTLIQSPTNIFAIVGRVAVQGEADIPNVHAIQNNIWVTPLSLYPERPDNSQRVPGDWDLAPFDGWVGDELKFWEQMRAGMKLFPPPAAEQGYTQKFEPLGLLADESPYVNPNPDPKLVEILKAGAAEFKEFMEATVAQSAKVLKFVNGWSIPLHIFDYNTENFQIGTIDAPKWKIEDRAEAFFMRAFAARIGLWGNHAYEAVYPIADMDGNGDRLVGEHQYVFHLDELPPCDAFWSLTMYQPPKFYLVANPINRYSIGDRTPGLKYNDDGSLDIYFQHESPGAEKESNWLPASEGPFRVTMRIYQPHEAVLDGSYILPSIQKVA